MQKNIKLSVLDLELQGLKCLQFQTIVKETLPLAVYIGVNYQPNFYFELPT